MRSEDKRVTLPEPVTDRGRETRQKILAAAEKVFGEMGFHDASVSRIVQEAGVGQGTFYLYFPSKRDVFVAVVDYLADELRREIRPAVAGFTARAQVERAGFRAFFQFVAKHPLSYRIVRQAEFVDQEAFQRYYRNLAKGYRRGLEAAGEAGEFRPLDAEAVSYALMGIGDFVGLRYILWQDPGYVPDTVLDDVMTFILHGLQEPSAAGTHEQ
jgi:AcrR family transcriptional regulator